MVICTEQTLAKKRSLPKPLRNLFPLRCSFSLIESRYSCNLTSNSPEKGEGIMSLCVTSSPACGFERDLAAAPLYLSEPACGAPSPGWTSQTSGSPWRPPGSDARSWRGSLYESPPAGRHRGPRRRTRRSSRPPVRRWWRAGSGRLAPRKNGQRPQTRPCWAVQSLERGSWTTYSSVLSQG